MPSNNSHTRQNRRRQTAAANQAARAARSPRDQQLVLAGRPGMAMREMMRLAEQVRPSEQQA